MKLFNQTKKSYTKAYSAVTSLKSSPAKVQLFSRLNSNVKLHIDRAVAYIDALNAGKKIETLTNELKHLKKERYTCCLLQAVIITNSLQK